MRLSPTVSRASDALALALSEKSSPHHASLPHQTSASACTLAARQHTRASNLIHISDSALQTAALRVPAHSLPSIHITPPYHDLRTWIKESRYTREIRNIRGCVPYPYLPYLFQKASNRLEVRYHGYRRSSCGGGSRFYAEGDTRSAGIDQVLGCREGCAGDTTMA